MPGKRVPYFKPGKEMRARLNALTRRVTHRPAHRLPRLAAADLPNLPIARGRGGMVDAGDLKSLELCSCGFESRRPHHASGNDRPISRRISNFVRTAAAMLTLLPISHSE